jgi:hypothetical protein
LYTFAIPVRHRYRKMNTREVPSVGGCRVLRLRHYAQLIDDLLDFTANTEALGKPTANDLRLGIATAPVLYAAEEYPELIPLIDRSFKEEGDVETVRLLCSLRWLASCFFP